MTPATRSFLVAVAKNAINAVITNAALITAIHDQFNLSTANGWIHIAKLTGSVILAREIVVWGPKVLAWSQSSDSTEVPDDKSNDKSKEMKA